MGHSIEPRDRIYVKGHGFLSFDKNLGKTLVNKYSKHLLDSATDVIDAIRCNKQYELLRKEQFKK